MKQSIFWIIGGAAVIYLLSRASFAKKANFIFKSISPSGTILSPRIIVTMLVQNPTNQNLTVKSVVGSLYINDEYLSNVSSFGDQIISANSESELKITARPSAIGIFKSLKNLLKSKGSITAKFTGTANVEGITVPINETQTI
jgi:hypothetical protein